MARWRCDNSRLIKRQRSIPLTLHSLQCNDYISYHIMSYHIISPIGSMYGIYANIGGILMVNVTIYSIHGSYGSYHIISCNDYLSYQSERIGPPSNRKKSEALTYSAVQNVTLGICRPKKDKWWFLKMEDPQIIQTCLFLTGKPLASRSPIFRNHQRQLERHRYLSNLQLTPVCW